MTGLSRKTSMFQTFKFLYSLSSHLKNSKFKYNFFRLLQRFYTVDRKLGDDGVKSILQLRETVPSFLFFLSMAIPLMITATGRALYLKASIGASIFSLFWMGITA